MDEIYKAIADFSITTNLLLEFFQNRQVLWKHWRTRRGVIAPPDSGKIQKSSGNTAQYI